MFLLLFLIPLVNAFTLGFFGRFFGQKGSSLLSCFFMWLCTLFSWLAFFEVGFYKSICHLILADWISIYYLSISWGFLFDTLTVVMLVIINTISTLVHMYSADYMKTDPHKSRFLAYLSLFTFFMIILVTSNNFLQMFLGWEGVGLSSYLLINFWATRLNANQSAIKAMIVNRLGDLGLIIGIFCILFYFKSLDYNIVFSLAPTLSSTYVQLFELRLHLISIITILLFIGSIGKSAQLSLHTWLPDAMEGPTPVSALIHAATMVTSGVFLLVRCSPLVEYTTTGLCIISICGSLTAIFAATTGVFQNDLKRVIAYSTCSQLGYMIFACGMSNYTVSMFHLFNHACFKALLFLSAGSIIHALNDEQDIRRMGGLIQLIPFTYCMMVIGSLSLAGLPFLTGFYSKDLLLELILVLQNSRLASLHKTFVFWLGCLVVFFTAFYSFRLLFFTFVNNSNVVRSVLSNVHESDSILLQFPLILLGLGSIFTGYLFKDLFVGVGSNFWGNAVFILPNHIHHIEAEENFLTFYKLVPLFFSLIGVSLAYSSNYLISHHILKLQLSEIGRWLTFFLNKKWYWDKIYNSFVISCVNFGYGTSFKLLDRGFIEFLGPYGLTYILPVWCKNVLNIQTGQIVQYLFFVFVNLSVLLFFFVTTDSNLIFINQDFFVIFTILLILLSSNVSFTFHLLF